MRDLDDLTPQEIATIGESTEKARLLSRTYKTRQFVIRQVRQLYRQRAIEEADCRSFGRQSVSLAAERTAIGAPCHG
jgi:hypothetical protein